MNALDASDQYDVQPYEEITDLDVIYDLYRQDLHVEICKTRYDELLDMEDPGNRNVQIKRYYQHGKDFCRFVEVDARLAAIYQAENVRDFLERFSPDPKGDNAFYYLRTAEKHELNGKMTLKAHVDGIIMRSPEQKEQQEGRDYKWEQSNNRVGQEIISHFDERWTAASAFIDPDSQAPRSRAHFYTQITSNRIDAKSFGETNDDRKEITVEPGHHMLGS